MSAPAAAKGTLYLVPTPLDHGCDTQSPLEDVLPLGTIKAAAALTHWISENAKSTRAFLKRVDALVPLAQPIQAQQITELPREVHKKGDHGGAAQAGHDERPEVALGDGEIGAPKPHGSGGALPVVVKIGIGSGEREHGHIEEHAQDGGKHDEGQLVEDNGHLRRADQQQCDLKPQRNQPEEKQPPTRTEKKPEESHKTSCGMARDRRRPAKPTMPERRPQERLKDVSTSRWSGIRGARRRRPLRTRCLCS